MHTVRDYTILGSLRFVSKSKEYQVYGVLIPKEITNRKMRNSIDYKTYLAFATGAETLKKARKFKKPTFPSKKLYLLLYEEPARKPVNKPATRRQSAVVDSIRLVIDEDDGVCTYSDDLCIYANENVEDEEFERINKEMYSDVNVEIRYMELEGEGKDDEEMTDAGYVDDVRENVNQDVASAQVKDVARTTITAAPATQTSKVTEDQVFKLSLLSKPIAPTTTGSNNSTTAVPDSSTLTIIHQRLSDVENEVKTLKNVDHISAIRAAVMSEVLIVVKEYLGTSLDDALHKALQRHTAELVKEHYVPTDVIDVLQQQPKPQKSVADILNIKMEQAGKQQ
ncbi:hypothetical protein Tco_1570463 [Tanacetum coccineum]